ncbi:MAG: PilZ domain-containing protein, partial [Myxococcota bacterium]
FARVRGGAIVEGTPPPQDLLIATPRRIDAVKKVTADPDGPHLVRLVVVNEDSNALREQLRRCGFDYLVRRPVHAEALRLLVLRCLYRGEERRREPRVAVGFEVGFRTGLKSRRAVLADLSVRGCRLISETPIDAGRRIRVNVPEALETGDPVAISGRVLRVDRPKEADRAHLYSAAVLFDDVGHDAREAIELLIEDLAVGPATLRRTLAPPPLQAPSPAPTPPEVERQHVTAPPEAEPALEVDVQLDRDPDPEPEPVEAPPAQPQPADRDRRDRRRAAYSHTVPAFGKRALRVLVGRDLSVGGMRIEPLPGLELGDRLHLAIYGDPGESPFLVWASVTRDDGDAGMALAFDPLDREIGERLERLVGSLPSVENLHDTEAQAMGTVMTEILTD